MLALTIAVTVPYVALSTKAMSTPQCPKGGFLTESRAKNDHCSESFHYNSNRGLSIGGCRACSVGVLSARTGVPAKNVSIASKPSPYIQR